MSFEVRGLTYGYRSGESVLRDVNLDIPAGATTAVLGMSGSGKSTLLYLLGLLWDGRLDGSITYRRGSETIAYQGLTKSGAAALRRTDFGFVLQSSYMLPHFSCAYNAAMPLALQGVSHPERSSTLLQLVQRIDSDGGEGRDGRLVQVMNNPAGTVSGGQRQRFAVVRAVVHDPRVVFADEPFSSLDEENTELTLDLLDAWRRGEAPGQTDPTRTRTLILVCHDPEIAYKRADYLVFVSKSGQVLENRAFEKSRFRGADDLSHVIRSGQLPASVLGHHDGTLAVVGGGSR